MKNEMDLVSQMFNDYEERNNPSDKKKFENILTKFFSPRNSKEYFRMLPPNKGEKIIETAYFHDAIITTNKGTQYKKYFCLGKNNHYEDKLDVNGNVVLDQNGVPVKVPVECPFCKEEERLLNMQDKSIIGLKKDDLTPEQKTIFDKNSVLFKEANKYKAKLWYIVAGIDRMSERDGKKFWRFKDAYKKNGVYDKLLPVINDFVQSKEVAPFNVEKGIDFSITVVDASMPNGAKYKEVSMITVSDQKPLHTDPKIADQFLNDKTSWRDVYTPTVAPNITSTQFLEMVLKNQTPYWDDSNPKDKHWVFPGNPELEAKARNYNKNDNNSRGNIEKRSELDSLNDRIGNLTQNDVGEYKDDFVSVTTSTNTQQVENTTKHEVKSNSNSYVEDDSFDDDLPF